jgi:hypothetical protein
MTALLIGAAEPLAGAAEPLAGAAEPLAGAAVSGTGAAEAVAKSATGTGDSWVAVPVPQPASTTTPSDRILMAPLYHECMTASDRSGSAGDGADTQHGRDHPDRFLIRRAPHIRGPATGPYRG